jgi:hypothetical protein
MTVSCSCPKLIVSGSSAEQPNPASAKAAIPAAGVPAGSSTMTTKMMASRKGSAW